MTADSTRRGPLTLGFSPDLTVRNASELRLGNVPWDLTRKRSQVQTLSRPPPSSQVRALPAVRWSRSLHAWAAAGPHDHPCRQAHRPFRARPFGAQGSTATTDSSRASSPRRRPTWQVQERRASTRSRAWLSRQRSAPVAAVWLPWSVRGRARPTPPPKHHRPGPRPTPPPDLPGLRTTFAASPASRPTRAVDRAARDAAADMNLDPFQW
jgi:hypothetical protein